VANRKIFLIPDEVVHGISNYVEVTSFEDLNEYMELIQSEESYDMELIIKNDLEIESFNAYGFVEESKRAYDIELVYKNGEYKVKEVQFEELSAIFQQLINNEKIEVSDWEMLEPLPKRKNNYDEILTIKYLKKSSLKTILIIVGILPIVVLLMTMFDLDIITGLIASLIVSIVVGFFMYATLTRKLIHMINQQESIIGYKIDEVFKNEDFTIGDYYSGRGSRNSVFFVSSVGEVILLRECVDTAALKKVIFSRSDEKKVAITLVNGAKINLRMLPRCAEEFQKWLEL